ncbi:MAG: hypothetical protein E7261_04755 [Lachnospiraceae bacterium]|nr:hypothetical protein [Lachnospiraceae bacterium]
MRIINDFKQIKSMRPTAVTIGKFEAVHKGHRKLLREVASCKKQGLVPTVFTFKNASVSLEDKEQENSGGRAIKKKKRFLENAYRLKFLEELGIELLIEIEFTKEFADVMPEDFIKDILIDRLNAKVIVTGENFRFGKNRLGDKVLLSKLQEKYGYEYRVFDMEKYHNIDISTTYAKELLSEHNYADLAAILGYKYPYVEKEQ